MTFKTTAIYPNRLEDKRKLHDDFPNLTEEGDETTKFYFQGKLIAVGYTRIVFGDHGPYVEFENKHFQVKFVNKFGREETQLPSIEEAKFYYYWLTPVGLTGLKVYWQIKPVTNLPNAPKREDGKRSNYNRTEGYADYKRGMFYINPYDMEIE